MKNIITICLVFLGFTSSFFAQNVGINASGAVPDASAMLDVDVSALGASAKKGVLFPRVSLTSVLDITTIPSPATSLYVYNTATAGASPNNVVPGFYYWNGAKWVAFGGSGGNDWALLGNSGTVAGTNFIGTTDAVDWVVKTNNTERMRLVSAGVFGIGTTVPATSGAGLSAITKFKIQESAAVAGNGVVEILNSSTNGITMIVEQSNTNFNTNNLVGEIRNNSGLSGTSAIFGLVQPSTDQFQIGVRGSGNNSGNIGVSGNIPTTGNWTGYGGRFTGGLGYQNGLYNLSDRRVKKEIRQINNALNIILNLDGIIYKYNQDVLLSAKGDNRDYYGFIAQDVEKVSPTIVATKMIQLGYEGSSTIDNSNEKNEKQINDGKVVDYVQLVPVLVEAIKEQQKQIEILKKEVEILKNN